MNLIQIENRTGRVKLNDAVTPWSADELIGDIEKLYGNKAVENGLTVGQFTAKADDALETLEFEINSPGGSVIDGYRVYHSIRNMRERGVRVVATVNGVAASMGSVIIMAADERRITQGSRIMIHEASQSVHGNAEDHARSAKILDEMSDEISVIYAGVTGGDKAEIRALMKAETWMGAAESVSRKFADSVIGKVSLDGNAKNVQKQSNDDMSILDRLLPNAELSAKYDVAQGELATAAITITDLGNKLKEADSLLAEAVNEARGFQNQVVTAKAEVESEKTAHSATRKELADAAALLEPVKLAERITVSANSEDEADAPIKEAIEKEVTNRIVAAGHPPIDTSNAEREQEAKQVLSSEAFNALSHHQRNEFIRNGGKLKA